MKRAAIVTSVLLALMNMQGAKAAEARPLQQKKLNSQQEKSGGSLIRVVDGPWGDAAPWQIEMLLNAITDEMLQHFPGRSVHPIVVAHSNGGPAVLYQKGPGNEYQVMLSAKGQNWAEYVYEFSHELVHILANYEHHAAPGQERHQWFEEMLCETVSLYMLKHFSLTWNAAPPLPETSEYAPALQAFTRRALSDRHRKLPAGMSFEQWFSNAAPRLVSSPYLRQENELVASLFLPLVEQNNDWRAVAYLNAGDLPKESSFREFLAQWFRSTPRHLRGFVEQSMQVFRIDKPDASYTAGIEPPAAPDRRRQEAAASPRFQ
ncbi:hypothetical protein [Noviherbaspirillum denitrificans]|uniref:Peptidase M1 membrane alanine aminopeptidase domain-containing protein n=1 Tax=Noviherbaspirillum denitrificans TaxID=1968433 RepID=A0A254TKV7_9BURK|nr:hypothetical protein [Noviherbaspirillum denitrificans]OWW21952.1 hypothetical protein AYR66_23120 [Noviherbaspirillum denitrificans]